MVLALLAASGRLSSQPTGRAFSSVADTILASLLDHEKRGVPAGAGASGKDGFDLARIHRLLADLGNPQSQLKAIHVAGTKGKGSVCTMLSSILHHSGHKVGTYTSPHISSLTERIAVNLRPIPSGDLDSLAHRHADTLAAANEREAGQLSHFEALTGLALRHFDEQQVDAAVIEAGLGGVRDATNVLDASTLQLAIITALSLEHQKALGDTLADIARAKAGICKPGRPLVIGPQSEPEAVALLEAAASAAGSPVIEASKAVSVAAGAIRRDNEAVRQVFQIDVHGTAPASSVLQHGLRVESRLLGRHQADNAATAVAAALQLHKQGWLSITADSIKAGLEAAFLPGRFQVSSLQNGRLWLVLDGAHTPASAAALSSTLAQAFPGQPLALVVAMASDKDHAGVMAALRKARPGVVVFTTVPIAGASDRSAPPGMLAGHWQAASFTEDKPLRARELIQANMGAAMEACQRELFSTPGQGVICVTGSLHAVGVVMNGNYLNQT